MAFRNKADLLLQYNPDILVIPECERPEKFRFNAHLKPPDDVLWLGGNDSKGLGIFSYAGFTLSLHQSYNPRLKWVAPIKISHKAGRFLLFAIWANNPDDKDGQYVTQVWKALAYYKNLIRKKNTLLIGDFNSNTIWDRPRRAGNHSTVVNTLAKKGIRSTYHEHFEQQQGKEAHPTFYLYRNMQKPYHLDYCFASADWLQHLAGVEIGDAEFWLGHSDHLPLITTFHPGVFT